MIHDPQVHPQVHIDNCLIWGEGERMKRNWPESVQLAATGFAWLLLSVKFSSLSLSHVWQLSMELHLVVMNHTFIKSHGVQESIKTLKKKSKCQYFNSFYSLNISSNVMPCSWGVRSTWHALPYTKQNQSVWGFSMPKGFGIGQHIGQILGTSKFTRTFGHTVLWHACRKLRAL